MGELRLALRRVAKRPGAALASVAALACAIGAAAVTWSTISAVLMNPLPVRDPEHLFVVGTLGTSGRTAGMLQTGLTYPYLAHVRDSGVFEQTAGAWGTPKILLVDHGDGALKNRSIQFVSHNYFDLLGVSLAAGRAFAETDDRRGAAPLALLSHRFWRVELQGASAVIGRTIRVNKHEVVIAGIVDRHFRGLSLAEAPDLYLPFHTIGEVAGHENF